MSFDWWRAWLVKRSKRSAVEVKFFLTWILNEQDLGVQDILQGLVGRHQFPMDKEEIVAEWVWFWMEEDLIQIWMGQD